MSKRLINETVQSVINIEAYGTPRSILEASLGRIVQHMTGVEYRPKNEKGEPLDKRGRVDPTGRGVDDVGGKNMPDTRNEEGKIRVSEDAHFAIITSSRNYNKENENPTRQKRDQELRSQMMAHTQNPDFRPDRGSSEVDDLNKAGWQQLMKEIRSRGLGAIRLSGVWVETSKDGSGADDPFERSVLIPGEPRFTADRPQGDSKSPLSLDWLRSVAKKYNQDGFIYKPKGSTEIMLFNWDAETDSYRSDMKWSTVGIRSVKQLQQTIAKLQELNRKFKEGSAKYDPDEWQGFGASIPKGSGKRANFMDRSEDEQAPDRTKRPGFEYEDPQWPENDRYFPDPVEEGFDPRRNLFVFETDSGIMAFQTQILDFTAKRPRQRIEETIAFDSLI